MYLLIMVLRSDAIVCSDAKLGNENFDAVIPNVHAGRRFPNPDLCVGGSVQRRTN